MLKAYLPFRKISLKEAQLQSIHEIELALHEAELRLDRELATVSMYKATLKRLKADHAN